MPNSAITFNTSGLATDTSPGLVGTGAQTFAGLKTLDGGALIKGDTTGAAIASGYVGQNLSSTSVIADMASGNYNALITINLTAGIYLVSGIGALAVNGATITSSLGVFGISTNARGFSTSDRQTTSVVFNLANYNVGGEGSLSLPTFMLRVDNANIYFPNGSVSTADRALKLVFYPGAFTGGPVRAYGSLYCIRIA